MNGAIDSRVGITGHQNLSDETAGLVRSALHDRLEAFGTVQGITSLAAGADQLFARAVLAAGGRLLAVIPSQDYESSFASERDRASFRELLERSVERVILPYPRPSEEAYWAAGREVVDRSDHLLAVWDGAASAGLGGTGDVVAYARERGKGVEVIWPAGARRR